MARGFGAVGFVGGGIIEPEPAAPTPSARKGCVLLEQAVRAELQKERAILVDSGIPAESTNEQLA